jgi:phospholipase C
MPIVRTLGTVISQEGTAFIWVDAMAPSGWYDFSVTVNGHEGLERRYAGRIESGEDGISDPAMG